MGDWDYYCFICAAAFIYWNGCIDQILTQPEERAEMEEGADGHDEAMTPAVENFRKHLKDEMLQWMEEFRLIGENAEAQGTRRCYFSGLARRDSYGWATITKGHDPVAPGTAPTDTSSVTVYRNFDNETETGGLPAHDSCLGVLLQAYVAARGKVLPNIGCRHQDDSAERGADSTGDKTSDSKPDPLDALHGLDLDVLFESLASKREEYRRSLDLDYGDMASAGQEQYFFVPIGEEPYILDPVNVTGLNEYISELPRLHRDVPMTDELSRTNELPATSDPFSALSLELLSAILLELPPNSLVSTFSVSRSLAKASSYNWFWKQRLQLDMPWLWELFANESVLPDATEIDWKRVYKDIHREVNNPLGVRFMGLPNRKRVWNTSKQILDVYFEHLRLHEAEQSVGVEIPIEVLENASCRHFRIVASPDLATRSSMAWFPTTEADLLARKELEIHWSKNCVSKLVFKSGSWSSTVGISKLSDKIDTVFFQESDWLKGFIFNIGGTEQSDFPEAVTGLKVLTLCGQDATFGNFRDAKRLLMPQQGHGIVGLKSESSEAGISRFGLLEYPKSGIAVQDDVGDSAILTYLWKDDIPPLGAGTAGSLKFDKIETGYWSCSKPMDLIPMERLMLGVTQQRTASTRSDAEHPSLDTITGISGSYSGQVFAIHRIRPDPSHGERITMPEAYDRVGPYYRANEMKFFPIDGPGGERIVGVEIQMGALVAGIRVITNRRRQCIWGKDGDNNQYSFVAPPGNFIAGLFCSYGYHSGDERLLSTMSVVYAMGPSETPPDFEDLRDECGRTWEPAPPPSELVVAGRLIGGRNERERAMFLDFTRPISKISGLLPAPTWLDTIEIGGFTVEYADNETIHCGYPSRVWPMDTSDAAAAVKELQKMTRHDGMAISVGRVKEGIAHVQSDEEAVSQPTTWSLPAGGDRIASVTVWATEALDGIQFHTKDGNSSPHWGKCGGSPVATIQAGESTFEEDGRMKRFSVRGMKVILGSIRQPYYNKTSQPIAVQALGVRLDDAEEENELMEG